MYKGKDAHKIWEMHKEAQGTLTTSAAKTTPIKRERGNGKGNKVGKRKNAQPRSKFIASQTGGCPPGTDDDTEDRDTSLSGFVVSDSHESLSAPSETSQWEADWNSESVRSDSLSEIPSTHDSDVEADRVVQLPFLSAESDEGILLNLRGLSSTCQSSALEVCDRPRRRTNERTRRTDQILRGDERSGCSAQPIIPPSIATSNACNRRELRLDASAARPDALGVDVLRPPVLYFAQFGATPFEERFEGDIEIGEGMVVSAECIGGISTT